jgi:predicted RNA-binding Zn-ribbon protein involved in translation (DUF1610 family)
MKIIKTHANELALEFECPKCGYEVIEIWIKGGDTVRCYECDTKIKLKLEVIGNRGDKE